jgi:hypothetical protein
VGDATELGGDARQGGGDDGLVERGQQEREEQAGDGDQAHGIRPVTCKKQVISDSVAAILAICKL